MKSINCYNKRRTDEDTIMGKLELKKLRRVELLELLLEERQENEELRRQVEKLKEQLADRNIEVTTAGTLAEAALRLNGVFEAADKAAAQYLENIHRMSAGSDKDGL